MMVENLNIKATVISATEYPDLVRQYGITGVPKTCLLYTSDAADEL